MSLEAWFNLGYAVAYAPCIPVLLHYLKKAPFHTKQPIAAEIIWRTLTLFQVFVFSCGLHHWAMVFPVPRVVAVGVDGFGAAVSLFTVLALWQVLRGLYRHYGAS